MDCPKVINQSLHILYIMHRGKFFFLKYFIEKDEEFIVLILRLYHSLIHNEILGTMSNKDHLEGIRNKRNFHHLETSPSHANKRNGPNWDYSAKYTCQQYICHGKNAKKIRMYYPCGPKLRL